MPNLIIMERLRNNKSLPPKQILAIVLIQAKEYFTRDWREVP